jgi:hypothetical protein
MIDKTLAILRTERAGGPQFEPNVSESSFTPGSEVVICSGSKVRRAPISQEFATSVAQDIWNQVSEATTSDANDQQSELSSWYVLATPLHSNGVISHQTPQIARTRFPSINPKLQNIAKKLTDAMEKVENGVGVQKLTK